MARIKQLTQDYYDKQYFAGQKTFKMPNGTTRKWGYNNPDAEFTGAQQIVEAWKTIFQPQSLLDFGCGRGTFLTYARDISIEADGFDYSKWAIKHPYPRCKPEWLKIHDATEPWPYKDDSYAVVVGLDVMEHLYLPDLPFVIDEMYRVAEKYVFLQIATVDGINEHGYILKKDEPIPFEDPRTWAGHCTVATETFWYEQLDRSSWMPRRDMVNWFISLVDDQIISNWLKNSIIIMEFME